MSTLRRWLAVFLVGVSLSSGCIQENEAASSGAPRAVQKGGDNRTGAYEPVADWWKPAPEHDSIWRWGQVSGLVADTPDRIIVGITGDRNAQGQVRPNSSNYLVVVNANGDIIENWTQWDTVVSFPHQLYISPYDPERHIWVVERGGGARNVHEQIFKFTNDGKQLVMRLLDPRPRESDDVVRANKNPGPLDFGQPATLTFLPNGDFLLADGYQNGRIVRYNERGEFVSEFGSVGSGPGQFDLVHGVAVDRDMRIYVSDRDNNRIQVFSEQGEFIEEWPDILGPTGIYIDERENVWVLSTTLNQILEFNKNGELQYQFGAYCCTRGGFDGGLSRPHQMSVGPQGNLYIANYDGGYVTKYVPKPGADPNRLVGQPLLLPR
jgi:DNA-binding beta-propeller fold protein YncE